MQNYALWEEKMREIRIQWHQEGKRTTLNRESQFERVVGPMTSSELKWATQVEKATIPAKAIVVQIK